MIRRTGISTLLAVVVFGATATEASAAKAVRCHVPNVKGDTLTQAKKKITNAHCATGKITGTRTGKVITQAPKAGRTEKRGTKVQIALKAPATKSVPATIIAPTVSYSTKVDPTFVQSPTNPLAVTYSYSADATQTQGAQVKDLAQDDQLPAGILNFYNGGSLACSENVGGSTSDGTCAVTYPTTGTYAVTTQYIPNGETAVTETDSETIAPFTTTTIAATSVGAVEGTFFPLGIAWTIEGPSGALATTFTPTFTITDTTTGQTIGTYTGSSTSASCYILDTAGNGDTTGFYFNGGTCWNGDVGYPGDLNYADSFALTVTYPGMLGYSASTSTPQVI